MEQCKNEEQHRIDTSHEERYVWENFKREYAEWKYTHANKIRKVIDFSKL